MRKFSLSIAAAMVLTSSAMVLADVKLSVPLGDGMVLQRDMKVPIWGCADPGEKVTVTFAGQSVSAVADAKGNWTVKLDPLRTSSTPAEMTITATNTITAKDILVGEVWLCLGQSNMQFGLKSATNGKAAIADAQNYPNIRLFGLPVTPAATPQAGTRGKGAKSRWAVCNSRSAGHFSAVGYFFGRELHKDLKVPIGLIKAAHGGTSVEGWTSREALNSVPSLKATAEEWDEKVRQYDHRAALKEYQQKKARWEQEMPIAKSANEKRVAEGEKPKPLPRRPIPPVDMRISRWRPAAMYNGVLCPAIPFAIRGVIWYQGEQNAMTNPYEYETAFPLMINDWRKRWGQGDFPFLFVQLPNYRRIQTTPCEVDATWPVIREAQFKTLSLPNTAMAVAIDLADEDHPGDIHPHNKQDVGKRLAIAARGTVYGQKIVYSGPLYKAGSLRIDGTRAIVKFNHVGGRLAARGGELKGSGPRRRSKTIR